jgi:hypothetical protein
MSSLYTTATIGAAASPAAAGLDPRAQLAGTYTDPVTGAIVDHYSTKRLVSQPVQQVEYVAQENISYVQHLVPETQTIQVPIMKQVPETVTSTVMEPRQVTSTVMEQRQVTSTVMEPKQITETIMVPQQITKTVMQPRQVTSTVLEPRQVTSTVMQPRQVASTVMKAIQEIQTQSITVQRPVQQAIRQQVQVPRLIQGQTVHEHEEIVQIERPRVVQRVVEEVIGGGIRGQVTGAVRNVGSHVTGVTAGAPVVTSTGASPVAPQYNTYATGYAAPVSTYGGYGTTYTSSPYQAPVQVVPTSPAAFSSIRT